MAAAGFSFDPARFKIERPPLAPSELTDKVKEKCRAGRFADAEILLQEALEKDSLNEQAFIQLVRLYCQDMKNRPAAEKLIAGAGDTFSPKLLDFLSGLLDEWMQLPVRSIVKRRKFLDWFRRQDPVEPVSKKISTIPRPSPASPRHWKPPTRWRPILNASSKRGNKRRTPPACMTRLTSCWRNSGSERLWNC